MINSIKKKKEGTKRYSVRISLNSIFEFEKKSTNVKQVKKKNSSFLESKNVKILN